MAIRATEFWSRKSLYLGAFGAWTAERTWLVSGITNELDAIGAVGVSVGDTHPLSARMQCEGIGASDRKGETWMVAARYSVPPAGGSYVGTGGDPLLEPATYQWDVGSASETSELDADGNPVVNSAGDPIEGGMPVERTTLHLVVERNEPFFDVQKALLYKDALNSDAFPIARSGTVAPGQCRCNVIRQLGATTVKSTFARVGYYFEFERGELQKLDNLHDGFRWQAMDMGRRMWAVKNGESEAKPVPICVVDPATGDLSPVTENVLLNGLGAPINSKFLPPSGYTADINPDFIGWALPTDVKLGDKLVSVRLKFKRNGKALPFAGLV